MAQFLKWYHFRSGCNVNAKSSGSEKTALAVAAVAGELEVTNFWSITVPMVKMKLSNFLLFQFKGIAKCFISKTANQYEQFIL